MATTYEANYKTGDGRIIFKVSAPTQKELFAAIADLQSIFEAEHACGMCNTPHPQFAVRPTDDGPYYELRCTNVSECGARFDFGQHKEGGTLFPKRKDADGNWLPNGGWYIWDNENKRRLTAPRGQRQAAQPQRQAEQPARLPPPSMPPKTGPAW